MSEKNTKTREEYVGEELEAIKKTKAMTLDEWEGIHICAEFPSVGMSDDGVDLKEYGFKEDCEYSRSLILSDNVDRKEMIRQAHHVLKLSQEIRRLKHKCGEEVWYGVGRTLEDREKEKNIYKNL